MKGVILAGGLGKRLYPLTKITNKHLLPIYDRPMIFYPLEKMIQAGIKDIMIVTGGKHAGSFIQLLANGAELGIENLKYAYQEGEDGIASALSLAEDFAGGDKICVILGDNIFSTDISKYVEKFKDSSLGAFLFLKDVEVPERFGVASFDESNILIDIEEKPANPKSKFAVTGIYLYDNQVFDIIRTLSPSERGEYEITDVSNIYIKQGKADYTILDGWWSDAGTFESLFQASNLVRELKVEKE